jgi:hypothetical protein
LRTPAPLTISNCGSNDASWAPFRPRQSGHRVVNHLLGRPGALPHYPGRHLRSLHSRALALGYVVERFQRLRVCAVGTEAQNVQANRPGCRHCRAERTAGRSRFRLSVLLCHVGKWRRAVRSCPTSPVHHPTQAPALVDRPLIDCGQQRGTDRVMPPLDAVVDGRIRSATGAAPSIGQVVACLSSVRSSFLPLFDEVGQAGHTLSPHSFANVVCMVNHCCRSAFIARSPVALSR